MSIHSQRTSNLREHIILHNATLVESSQEMQGYLGAKFSICVAKYLNFQPLFKCLSSHRIDLGLELVFADIQLTVELPNQVLRMKHFSTVLSYEAVNFPGKLSFRCIPNF